LIIDEIEYLAEDPKSGQDYSKVRKGYFRSKKNHISFLIELTQRRKKLK
jgi:toxin ParE1/3/4